MHSNLQYFCIYDVPRKQAYDDDPPPLTYFEKNHILIYIYIDISINYLEISYIW